VEVYAVEATGYLLSFVVREYLTIKRLNDFYYYLIINQIITISELLVRMFPFTKKHLLYSISIVPKPK